MNYGSMSPGESERVSLPRFAVRDSWQGALVFGLLGPLVGGAPLIVLLAIGGAVEDGREHGILTGVASFAGILLIGWLVALAIGGLPGILDRKSVV